MRVGERGGAHGAGGMLGRRRREHRLGLDKGGGKGIRNLWTSSACWPLNGLGRKAEQAGGRLGRLGQNLKRILFRNKN
jgi:hypothetical protein